MGKEVKYDAQWFRAALGAPNSRKPIPGEAPPSIDFSRVSVWKRLDTENESLSRTENLAEIDAAKHAQDAWEDFWNIEVSPLIRERLPKIAQEPDGLIKGEAISSTLSPTQGEARDQREPIVDVTSGGVMHGTASLSNAAAGMEAGTSNAESTLDSPGVDLHELASGKYTYEAYPYGLIRAMRRVFARFNIEAFVEDRTFPDYRNHLDQEWGALHDEVKDFSRRAADVGAVLRKFDERLEESDSSVIGKSRIQLAEMLCAIQEVDAQIQQVARLRDSGYTARIFETLRELHGKVQSKWGTWARQVREPSLYSLVAAAIAFGLYVALVSSIPTLFWAPLCGLLPMVAFGAKYYQGRAQLNKLIDVQVKKLAIFHPEPAVEAKENKGESSAKVFDVEKGEAGIAARKYSIWYGGRATSEFKVSESGQDPIVYLGPLEERVKSFRKRLVGMGDRAYARVLENPFEEKSQEQTAINLENAYTPGGVVVPSKSLTCASFILFVILVLVAALLFCLHHTTTYAVERSVDDGACVLATGRVWWLGSSEVVVRNSKTDGFSIVPRDQILRITSVSKGQEEGIPCLQRPRAAQLPSIPAHLTMVNVSAQSPIHKGVLVVPFSPDGEGKVTCNRERIKGDKGAAISEEMSRVLKNVASALNACRAQDGALPAIDVRGFASSREFDPACSVSTDVLNADLAEARRTNVLEAMKFDKDKFSLDATGKWTAPFARLIPPHRERWAGEQHMRDSLAFRDRVNGQLIPGREALSRHVEIWLLDLAGCDTFNISPALR